MTVAPTGGEEAKQISDNLIAALGILSIVAIYAATMDRYLAFLGGFGIILANLWGANGVRKVAKYGIGTGVPSVGMLGLGGAVGAVIAGLYFGQTLPLAAPLVAFVLALIVGFVIGFSARYILKMNIQVMVRCMTEICGAGALLFFAHFATITGSIGITGVEELARTGVIMLIFIIGALGILHPYNACLGADENQQRTLRLALATGGVQFILAGIASILFLGSAAVITITIGALAWMVAFRAFVRKSFEDGIVYPTGLIPEVEMK